MKLIKATIFCFPISKETPIILCSDIFAFERLQEITYIFDLNTESTESTLCNNYTDKTFSGKTVILPNLENTVTIYHTIHS